MCDFHRALTLLSILTIPLLATPSSGDWPTPQRESKPGVIWWVPGSAMTEADTTFNLEQLSAAGFGGMSMVPIYGVRGAEDRFLDHLSPAWNRQYAFVVAEAHRLGLWVDLTPGTGWKIGGPTVTQEMGEQAVRLRDGQLLVAPNRSKVKRAAPGGAGLSIDPYNTAALDRFLATFAGRLELSPARVPRAFYHDSFEYNGNWTSQLPEVFRQQHGYDITEYAEALFGRGGDEEISRRVQADYRATLSSLHYTFVQHLRDWAHAHGSQLREQAHGAPGNILDFYALADIPETEVFGTNRFDIQGLRREEPFIRHEADNAPLVNRLASSASHISGGKLVSSESFTWLREHFNTALSEIKPEVDSLFVTGINHLFYHGNCFSAKDAEWPGWLFYASTEVNPRNAFWRDIPALNEYITRCQSVLQAGEIDNDVLLYWPISDVYMQRERSPHVFFRVHNHDHWLTQTSCGKTAMRLIDAGVFFDFVSDRFLQTLSWEDGHFRMGKSQYRALVIPPCEFVPVATMQRLEQLSKQGAKIRFLNGGPQDVPGLGRLESRRREWQAIQARIGDSISQGAESEVAIWLQDQGVIPEELFSLGLRAIRRRDQDNTYYFITNPTASVVSAWVTLSRPFTNAERWDPMTDQIGQMAIRRDRGQVLLQLASGQSCLVKLTSGTETPSTEPWPNWELDGQALPIEGSWQVTFTAGGPNLPPAFETAKLDSWTSSSQEAERFAGTATYRTTLNIDREQDGWRLLLGDVRESARVFVDDRHVTTLVAHPYQCDLPRLDIGQHELRIEVTNLSSNRIRDLDRRGVNWKKFYDINYVNINYKPFDASEWPIRPSGLLGPLRLQPLKAMDHE